MVISEDGGSLVEIRQIEASSGSSNAYQELNKQLEEQQRQEEESTGSSEEMKGKKGKTMKVC